ncbi:MAG: zinc ribbon domain-containing protein [Candidatus Aminicenantes bacterium]|nr:zinc ribbon domain-containing protein [Candidatus Aminicenantes bacterium]
MVKMFFFIGGIQPRTVKLDDTPRTCPSCGHISCRQKKTDHYFSLFFIPLFPVKKESPFLDCEHCGRKFEVNGSPLDVDFDRYQKQCPYCGRPLDPDFDTCPSCGKKVR